MIGGIHSSHMRYISMLYTKRLHRYEGGIRPWESPHECSMSLWALNASIDLMPQRNTTNCSQKPTSLSLRAHWEKIQQFWRGNPSLLQVECKNQPTAMATESREREVIFLTELYKNSESYPPTQRPGDTQIERQKGEMSRVCRQINSFCETSVGYS